jgi:PKD repeat protein
MIASYAWDFGDGTTGAGVTATHSYGTGGSYSVALTVTDDKGATGTSRRQLAVAPLNRSPVPTLLEQSNALTASFWGNQSVDPDGTVVGYAWTFGDGSTGSTASLSHAYPTAGTYTVTLTVRDNSGATATTTRAISVYAAGVRPTQAQWLTDLNASMDGGTAYLDANTSVPRPAIVLDIDNTSLQSYYKAFAATPAVLAFEQRAIADGYTILFATGRALDSGGTSNQLTSAGYRVDALCFKDPTAASTQASKTACRAAWATQGYTIVADVGNHTTDLDGGNSGQEYLLPNYGFLD